MSKKHISHFIEEEARKDPQYAIAHALMELAAAQQATARAIQLLGNGDALTSHGAMEAFSIHIGEKIDGLAEAIKTLAPREERRPSIRKGYNPPNKSI